MVLDQTNETQARVLELRCGNSWRALKMKSHGETVLRMATRTLLGKSEHF